jgi:Family of unknown function (DUF6544)
MGDDLTASIDRLNDTSVVRPAMALPAAAARWLQRSVPPTARTPSRVEIAQRGSMEANGRWLNFTARATYQAQPLAYQWRARLRVLPALWVIARDGHDQGEGWGGAWLMGFKTIHERRGPDVLPMQLIRNLAELAFVPDLAEAAAVRRWSDAHERGTDAFEITADVGPYDAGTSDVVVRFDVDSEGDLVRAWSPARPIETPEGDQAVPWRCDFSGHRAFDGIRIPTVVVATYEFEEDPWEYFRGEVTAVKRTFVSG